MEYIYSVMLLHSAGKTVNEENISAVLKAAGIEPDTSKIKALVAALEDVDIKSVISQAAVAPVATASAPAEKKEEKKKEEEKKVSEEEAVAGLGALFG